MSSRRPHDQPHIVMIMVDQMAADVIGAVGHPVVKTPNLDALVASGTTFANAYCNSPLCAPSRASFITGTLTRHNGVYDNAVELAAQVPTFMHHLRRSGYETVLAGKMHFIGPDQLHGFEHRLTTDIYPTSFDWTPDWSRGAYANVGTSVRRLESSGPCDWNMQLAYDEEVMFRASERLRSYAVKGTERPVFMCVSLTHPHDPFVITEEYWERYEGVPIPPPSAPPEPFDDLHEFNRWIQIHHECDAVELTAEQVTNARRGYYAMVSYVDDAVGRIMREVERCGWGEDALVIFTSDHGEMLGEHGMWFKRTYFDPAVKVPLIVRWPGRVAAGRAVEEVVSLVDLNATLMEIGEDQALEPWRPRLDGDSFRTLLLGEDAGWKDEAIFEYLGEGGVKPLLGIRRGRYKYVYVHGPHDIFYDLVADPHESTNLAGVARYQAVIDELRRSLLAGLDPEQLEQAVLASQRERLRVAESLNTGQWTSWDHQPAFDAAQQYARRAKRARREPEP